MKPNLNLKGSQCHNVEPDKPLNQSLQSRSENVSYTSSNGPSKNHCRILEVNLKACAKGTKWRVYSWLYRLSCSFWSSMLLMPFSLWFLHCLLGCYGLVIVALIFHSFHWIQEISDCASICCLIFKEFVAFHVFLLRLFPRINPLIIKPIDKIMKWILHIW